MHLLSRKRFHSSPFCHGIERSRDRKKRLLPPTRKDWTAAWIISYCLWAGTPWCRSLRRLTKILCILRLRCRPCGRCCWNPTTNKRGLLSVRCFPSLHPARSRCVQSCVERIPGGQIQAKSRLFHFPLSPPSKLWGCSPPGVRCTSYNRNQSWLLQWSSLGISQHLWAWQTPV